MTELEWFVAIFWGLFLAGILAQVAITHSMNKRFDKINDRLEKLEANQ